MAVVALSGGALAFFNGKTRAEDGYLVYGASRDGVVVVIAPFADGGQRDYRSPFIPLYGAGGIALRAVFGRCARPRQFARHALVRACRGKRAYRFRVVRLRTGRGRAGTGVLRLGADLTHFPAVRFLFIVVCKAHRFSLISRAVGRGRRDVARPYPYLRALLRDAFGYADACRLPDGNGARTAWSARDGDCRHGKTRCAGLVGGKPRFFRSRCGDCFRRVLSGCFFSRFILYYA